MKIAPPRNEELVAPLVWSINNIGWNRFSEVTSTSTVSTFSKARKDRWFMFQEDCVHDCIQVIFCLANNGIMVIVFDDVSCIAVLHEPVCTVHIPMSHPVACNLFTPTCAPTCCFSVFFMTTFSFRQYVAFSHILMCPWPHFGLIVDGMELKTWIKWSGNDFNIKKHRFVNHT